MKFRKAEGGMGGNNRRQASNATKYLLEKE
jgi:hypothetical protein